uniref:Uncharacterized protein n=1 Tax=Physcomitrium patens TaxID=3218 RepID=A0A2K1KPU6_PHYPA|nr:hypothetical protein PHYPA_006711 [Physcomitrium patens]
MAKVIEEVTTLEGCSMKVVPSYMKGYQLEVYKKIDINNLDDSVYRNSIYYSLMTFWDGTYSAYNSLQGQGFVNSSYSQRFNLIEYFFYYKGSREGLINTGVITFDAEYFQRRMSKSI